MPAKTRRPASKHMQAREAAKQETREALIQAATEIFAEQGLDASLDEICAHAGYTRGAFYVHFKNRDELAAAVMQRVGEGVLNTLLGTDRDAPVDSLEDLITRFVQALISGDYPLTKAGGVRPYQLLDACARSSDIRDQYIRHVSSGMDRLAGIVERLQARGEIRRDIKPDQLGFWLVTLVIGLHTLYDLEMPIDFSASMQSLIALAKP